MHLDKNEGLSQQIIVCSQPQNIVKYSFSSLCVTWLMGQRGMYYYTALTVPRKPSKLLACCDYELTMSSVAACPHNQHDSAMTTLYTGSHTFELWYNEPGNVKQWQTIYLIVL